MAKKSRGRLNGIELLPEECGPIIAWAADQLRDRDRTQTDIYQEFYAKMEALLREHRGELNFVIPSFSAFSYLSSTLDIFSLFLSQIFNRFSHRNYRGCCGCRRLHETQSCRNRNGIHIELLTDEYHTVVESRLTGITSLKKTTRLL